MTSMAQRIWMDVAFDADERPLKIGDVVRHPSTGRTVRITGGQYWGAHGLSNFWYWEDTETGEEGNGYGWSVKP